MWGNFKKKKKEKRKKKKGEKKEEEGYIFKESSVNYFPALSSDTSAAGLSGLCSVITNFAGRDTHREKISKTDALKKNLTLPRIERFPVDKRGVVVVPDHVSAFGFPHTDFGDEVSVHDYISEDGTGVALHR